MPSPFNSIYDHEREHELMAKSGNAGKFLMGIDSGVMESTTYDGDDLVEAVIDGHKWTYTYENGKIKTISAFGFKKTFTWNVDKLVSVSLSRV